MQHLREILEEIEEKLVIADERILHPDYNKTYQKGRFEGFYMSRMIILRKIAELEEKGEC